MTRISPNKSPKSAKFRRDDGYDAEEKDPFDPPPFPWETSIPRFDSDDSRVTSNRLEVGVEVQVLAKSTSDTEGEAQRGIARAVVKQRTDWYAPSSLFSQDLSSGQGPMLTLRQGMARPRHQHRPRAPRVCARAERMVRCESWLG